MFHPAYPPKNRRKTKLGVLHIEIERGDGVMVLTPNDVIGLALSGGERMEEWRPVPGRTSDISGGPALLYRAEDYEIALAADELFRFCARNLAPEEHRALLEKFGDFFEIHEDFYEFQTGTALQPVPSGPRRGRKDGPRT